jgi:hypothetical protein
MPPKPAAIATPPMARSPPSSNPAVPPPPVCGAAGYDVGLAGGVYGGLEVGLAGGDVVSVGLPVVGLPVGLAGELAVPVPVSVPVGVGVYDDAGVDVDVVVVPDGEQAESATATTTVISPQPTAGRPALRAVRPMAVRACMKPPHVPGNDHHFQITDGRNRRRKGNVWRAEILGGRPKGLYGPPRP